MSEPFLRRVATDNDYVRKCLDVLESRAHAGEIEPWFAVVLAEWMRSEPGRRGEPLTAERYDALFLDEELMAIMREQVDGPWAVYKVQARAHRANALVMSFLTQLEQAATAS